MDLKVILNNCILQDIGNHFIVVQIDEIQYADRQKKTTKFRSEVSFNSATPLFKKNVFLFEGLSYGNKMTLKIGCFATRLLSEPEDTRKLLDHSILKGSSLFTLTVKLLQVLRIEGTLQHDMMLLNDSQQSEVGRVTITLRHKSHDLIAQIEEDVDRIENVYYDPFETDKEVISKRLKQIDKMLVKRQDELQQITKQTQFIRTAHKTISYDQAALKNQKEALELQNDQLRIQVEKKNDVKELHIQIDLLKHTEYGQALLQKKLVILLKKLEFERQLYNELSNHYYSIESSFHNSKNGEKETTIVKETIVEQDFLIKRCQDQLPQVKNLTETIHNQENIIINLQDQIKQTMKNNSRLDSKELQYNLEKLRNDREILKQKSMQLQGVREINKGEIPREIYNKFRDDAYIADNPIIIRKFKQRSELLMKELEIISTDIEQMNTRDSIKGHFKQERQDNTDINILELEIEQSENKAEILQEQMIAIARNYAKQLGELRGQQNEIESNLQMHKAMRTNQSYQTQQSYNEGD